MKAIPQNEVQRICTAMSTGITLKIQTADTPNPVDEATELYLTKITEIVKKFQALGWQVREQAHEQNRYLVCAKYELDRPDHKLLDEARRTLVEFAPPYLYKEFLPDTPAPKGVVMS